MKLKMISLGLLAEAKSKVKKLEPQAHDDFITDIVTHKEKTQKSNIHSLLGFKQPLKLMAQGTFASIFYHPTDPNILIKVTSHKEDVQNTVRAQRANSDNVVKLYPWPDGKLFKPVSSLKSWAMLVERIQGEKMPYSTGHFYKLDLNGNFENAAGWLNAGGTPQQNAILDIYDRNTDLEQSKLADLFNSLHSLRRYGIDLSDFDENIIDAGDRYVLVDLGF